MSASDAKTPILVHTTVGSLDEARRLAHALVERRLAACAHVEEIESVYRWKGVVESGPEWRVTFKTGAARYPAIEQAIRELHGYDLPAIHALAMARVYAPYAAWIEENSTG